jgi:hypothetical protein
MPLPLRGTVTAHPRLPFLALSAMYPAFSWEEQMVSSDAYLAMVRDRLVEDGCEVTEEAVGSLPAMVGYRSNIRALSKMHLFTIVASVPEVNAVTVRDFSRQASDYAKGQKGRLRGAQSGVLALAALVTPKADDAAKKIAANPFRLGVGGFAAMVQPAVVDLTEGRVHTFQGRRLWGAAFAGYLRQKSALYLPDPG